MNVVARVAGVKDVGFQPDGFFSLSDFRQERPVEGIARLIPLVRGIHVSRI